MPLWGSSSVAAGGERGVLVPDGRIVAGAMRLLFCAFVLLIFLDGVFLLGSIGPCFPRDGEEGTYYRCVSEVHRANQALGVSVVTSIFAGLATVIAGVRVSVRLDRRRVRADHPALSSAREHRPGQERDRRRLPLWQQRLCLPRSEP
jgi:ABC-type Fe3+ transport system permease subunit